MRVHRLTARTIGFVRGELSAAGLEGLRIVGADAYDVQERADAVRDAKAGAVDVETQLFLVCSWNAFALQTIADHVLDADARLDPRTAGFLPPPTLAFAQRCYLGVPNWLEWARNAELHSGFRPTVALPSPLPPWPRIGRTRRVHVGVLEAAYESIAPRAESDAHAAGAGAAVDVLLARMVGSAEKAARLRPEARTPERLREVRDALVQALEDAYVLGQIAAMPSLVDHLQTGGSGRPMPLSAIACRWLVLDSTGASIGTVVHIEGEPSLGKVTGVVVSSPLLGVADRRADAAQIRSASPGVVRLGCTASDLEPV